MASSAKGQVSRLSAHTDATYLQLESEQSDLPKNGYFVLKLDNQNYNALYSLALAAAVNRLTLNIKTVEEITPTDFATVDYLLIIW
jgi:hypothetical protein